jgi:hypothetical protein
MTSCNDTRGEPNGGVHVGWLSAIVIVLLGMALFAFRGATTQTGASTRRAVQFSVINRTETLKVVSIEPGEGFYFLTLRNDSPKNVTGYAYRVAAQPDEGPSLAGHVSEGIHIDPWGTGVDYLGDPAYVHSRRPVLNILAVYFTDASGEGDERVVQEFRDTEAGYDLLVRQVRPMVQELAATPDGELWQALDDLAVRIRNLAEPPEVERSFSLKVGFRSCREMAAIEVERLAANRQTTGLSAVKEKIAQVKERYDKQWRHFTSVRETLTRGSEPRN